MYYYKYLMLFVGGGQFLFAFSDMAHDNIAITGLQIKVCTCN